MKRKLAMFMAIILMIGCFTGAVAENAAPDMPALDAQPDSIWQKLADEGVISEETLSAIQQYLQENRPDMPEAMVSPAAAHLKCPITTVSPTVAHLKCPITAVSPAPRPKNQMAASPTANVPTMRPKCPAAIISVAAAHPKCPTAMVSPMAISPAAQ